jgi:DNA-binding response OmpR family regulator
MGEIMNKYKILLVDDDRNLSYLLRMRLENENFEVASAHSATEGYLMFLAFKPDLVLTDISMGDENGLDLMREIRRLDPSVGTIYMTADPSRYRSELKAERELNRALILEKPVSGRKLVQCVCAQVNSVRPIAA